MAPAICFRSAVVLLGRFPALAGVDLDVDRGESVLVQGPNGAGKTTLLRACAGLVPVVAGQATVLGHDLRRARRDVRRDVALLGHATQLYDDLSVSENVRFALRASRRGASGTSEVLGRLGLDGRLAGVAVARLSAGQRRRTALAICIARDPGLWLLDEPHAGLDAQGRDVLDEAVRAAVARGATVLMASHEAERARALASRAVTMAGGQLHHKPGRQAPAERRGEPAHVA